jgi:hypothetical protein
MKTYLSVLFMILALASCNPSTSLTEKEKAIIVEEVQRTLDDYYNDTRKSGLTAEFKYLDHSPGFFWVPPGYATPISYDSVAAILNRNAPQYLYIDNTFDTLRIIPLSKELATYTGRLTSKMTDRSNLTKAFSLVETGVLIRRQDGWKLLNGQTSLLAQ